MNDIPEYNRPLTEDEASQQLMEVIAAIGEACLNKNSSVVAKALGMCMAAVAIRYSDYDQVNVDVNRAYDMAIETYRNLGAIE